MRSYSHTFHISSATKDALLTHWAIGSLAVARFNKTSSLESYNGEKENKLGIAAMFPRGLVPMKKKCIVIVKNRTKNREGCPWLRRLRRIGGIKPKGTRHISHVSSVQVVPA